MNEVNTSRSDKEELLEKQHIAIASSMDGIALLNAQGQYYFLNDVHVKMFGYDSQEELIGKTWQYIYGQAEINRINNDLFPLLMANGKWSGETLGKSKTGTPVYQEISLTALPDGGLVCICRDISEKKKSREKLELQEQILKNTNSIAIVTNADKEIVWVNAAFTRLTGYTEEEVIGKNPGHLLQGKLSDKETVKYMSSQLAMRKPYNCEIINYKKDGTPYWIEIKCTPLLHPDGSVDKYFAIEEDITERKNSEQHIVENSIRLENAMEGAKGALWDWDMIKNTVYYSKQWKSMLGYQDHEIGNDLKEWESRIHPDDIAGTMKEINNYISGITKSYKNHLRIRHKNNSYLYWLDQGIITERTKDGTPIRMVGAAFDITELKVTQEKLKDSEERWNFALVGTGAGIWDWNSQNDTIFYSAKAMAMIDYKNVIGENPMETFKSLIHPDHVDEISRVLKSMEKDVNHATIQYKIRSRSGKYIWVEDNAMVVQRNAFGYPVRLLGSFVDITDRKNTEIELIRAKELAEALVKKERHFLANISHELRTPLHAVIGLGEQLEKSDLKQQQKDFVSVINKSAKHLLGLISDVLDLSKIAEGKISLEYIGFSFTKILFESIQLVNREDIKKRLQIQYDGCNFEQNHFINGDPLRLKQIFLNILGNAIKFTEKGTVTISYRISSETATTIGFEISIADTGIGMDTIMLNRLFEEFVQEDQSYSRKYGGSGLGLSITRKLVEMMKGNIHFSSMKNEGTVVTINLTFEKAQAVSVTQIPTESAFSNFNNLRVLLVEDSIFNMLVATTVLNNFQIFPEEASNGLEAVTKLKAGKQFDVILMDIQMPEMDGLEATRIIREELKINTPIIAITANAVKEELESYIEKGMNDYITKPFEEKTLLGKIEEWAYKTN